MANKVFSLSLVDKTDNLLKLEKLTKELEVRDLKLQESENKYKELSIKLEEERDFLNKIIDSLPGLFFVKDEESKFVLVNDNVVDLYGGKSKEDFIGKSDEDFNKNPIEVNKFHLNDIDVIKNKTKKVILSEPVTNYLNETRYFKTTKVPVINDDGSCNKLIGISIDITDLINK